MNFFSRTTLLATFAFTAFGAQAKKSHMDGIEFQMRQDEQALVSRTYQNAEKLHQSAEAQIKKLNEKISDSSGSQAAARKARKARIQAMDKIINGCVMREWHKLEGDRASSAEAIDQLIQSFQSSIEE
jgi:uncharacterized protein YlxW (UPF0749 family)